ncbi:MAG: hypothetical protein ACYST5_07200 [Planctomycetota bacterium]|jgi:hypothetical protein
MNRHLYAPLLIILGVSLIVVSILYASESNATGLKRDASSEQLNQKPLSRAVEEFNQKATKNHVGKTQPPLTEDEVVACIRAWNRRAYPVTDEVFAQYQQIADTKTLPKGVSLDFHTELISEPYHFDVWWIDLELKVSENADGIIEKYSFRLRDRKLRCRPLTDEELKRIDRSLIPEEIRRILEQRKREAEEDSRRGPSQ